MTFLEAIKTCVSQKYFKTNGRASRVEFWYFYIFYVGIIVVSFNLVPFLEKITTSEFSAKNDFGGYWLIFLLVFGLGLILPFNNVHVRRLNDINTSGIYWMGTFGGLLILGQIIYRTIGLADIIGIGIWIIYGIILILCLKPGDKNDNRFGKNIYTKIRK
tara:strand:+ start:90 stop:569 length:480 start_codon:yes stop_codon:yes gene_type:complete